jgi:signal transduction histidine kinase
MLELDKGETLSWHDEESHDGMAALEDLGLPEQVMRDLFYGSPRASYVERISSNNAGSIFLIPIRLGAEAAGYLFLTDPDVGGSETVLRFLQEFFTKITPAIHNAYLVERLHSQVSREERAHLARELHDGAVQILSVAMIEMDTLILDPSSFKAKLIRIQSHLCDAMNGLRDLSQRMRSPEVEGKQLRRVLAALVDNFSRDAGISATFICSSDEVQLPARTCHEIVRIVQEALVNIRKHSRAHNVAVRLRESEDWLITIEDDGCGFDFSGRLHHAELDADGKGPAIIKERVRSAGGTLTIESRPGRGARLEVAFPNGF